MKKISIISALALALVGCGATEDIGQVIVGPNSGGQALSASLQGELGGVRASAEHEAVSSFFDDGFGGFLDIRAPRADGGAVMAGVFIEGIDLQELEPGTVIRSSFATGEVTLETPDGEEIDISDDAFVDGVGCSGEVEDEWETDEPADEVVITIDEGEEPGEVEVDVELDLPSGELDGTALVH
jgi:hypothetical protein